jgi:hypothetical protein
LLDGDVATTSAAHLTRRRKNRKINVRAIKPQIRTGFSAAG